VTVAIRRERIVRDSDAEIQARRRRQLVVTGVRAARRMAKAMAAIERRGVEPGEPRAPQERVSEVLNLFRREYEALTEHEQVQFEAVVKRYAIGRVPVDEWVGVVRSLQASYRATLPPESPPGGARIKAKDCAYSPPAGW
jgi:hypothetical protein